MLHPGALFHGGVVFFLISSLVQLGHHSKWENLTLTLRKNEYKEMYFKLLWQLQLGKKKYLNVLFVKSQGAFIVSTQIILSKLSLFEGQRGFTVNTAFCLNNIYETFL